MTRSITSDQIANLNNNIWLNWLQKKKLGVQQTSVKNSLCNQITIH